MTPEGQSVGQHWIERAERIYDERGRYIGECDRGGLWAPARGVHGGYYPLNLFDPRHWLSYLRSRLAGKLAWLEMDA